jgi:hypothetical protein
VPDRQSNLVVSERVAKGRHDTAEPARGTTAADDSRPILRAFRRREAAVGEIGNGYQRPDLVGRHALAVQPVARGARVAIDRAAIRRRPRGAVCPNATDVPSSARRATIAARSRGG